jgi:hypothetical protein
MDPFASAIELLVDLGAAGHLERADRSRRREALRAMVPRGGGVRG